MYYLIKRFKKIDKQLTKLYDKELFDQYHFKGQELDRILKKIRYYKLKLKN
jgi:hypothetical protein